MPATGSTTPVKVVFKARLLTLTMRLVSESKYSKSRTISVKVERHKEHGDTKIWYLYENTTKKPMETDSERHFGGAYLDYAVESGSATLDGVYWTNRNWENAYNTAGRIKLRRP